MFGTSKQLLLVVAFITSSSALGQSLWGSVKLDCAVSVWSGWTASPNSSYRTRTRTVYVKPQKGGALCPALIEREINPWNPKRTAADIAHALQNTFVTSRSVNNTSGLYKGRHRRQTQIILPRDILFIVDMSGSIGLGEFQTTKRAIADLVAKICGDVGQGNTQNRVAVISFSTNTIINFRFADHMTLQQVQNAIMAIPYEGRSTCLDKAIRQAADVFRTDAGMRADAFSVKEAVILTDGSWNCGVDDATMYNLKDTLSNVGVTRPIAIYAFVIGTPSGQNYQAQFDNLVAARVQNHLFIFTSQSIFELVVSLIVSFPGGCAPITFNGK